MYQYQSLPRQFVVYNYQSACVLYQGTTIPDSIKKMLADSDNNLIRFDSVGEFKTYLKLCAKYGKYNVKVHYHINKLKLSWIVDFWVDGIFYEYKCKQDDKRFLNNLQTLADYYPSIISKLIIVSPNLDKFTVVSSYSNKEYILKCLKINQI